LTLAGPVVTLPPERPVPGLPHFLELPPKPPDRAAPPGIDAQGVGSPSPRDGSIDTSASGPLPPGKVRPEDAGSRPAKEGRVGPRRGAELIGGRVRGYDQTNGRARPSLGGRRGPIVACLAMIAVAARALAAAPADDPVRIAAPASVPVVLTAERLRTWDDGPVRWALLEGQAAALQGVEGVRAGRILARFTPPQGSTAEARIELYAEGHVTLSGHEDASARPVRAELVSARPAQMKTYEKEGVERLPSPPRLPLIARAFPDTLNRPPAQPGAAPAIAPVIAPPVLVEAAPLAETPALAVVEAGPTPVDLPATIEPSLPDLPPAPPIEVAAAADPAATLPELPAVLEVTASTPIEAAPEAAPPPAADGPAPVAVTTVEDRAVTPAQFNGDAFGGNMGNMGGNMPSDPSAGSAPDVDPPPTLLNPLPDEARPAAEGDAPADGADEDGLGAGPLAPFTQRATTIEPRDGASPLVMNTQQTRPDGTEVTVIRGGVHMITTAQNLGIMDIEADNVVIFRKPDAKAPRAMLNGNGQATTDMKEPMEVYLEGNVIIRQDERKQLGNGDQKVFRGERAYIDMRTERAIITDGQVDLFVAGLIAPIKTKAPRIEQFREMQDLGGGAGMGLGLPQIRATPTTTSGSRFPTPGYRFNSQTIDLTRVESQQKNPRTGNKAGRPDDPNAPKQLTWRFDARQNFFYIGQVPVFYWPRFVGDADSIEPPLRQIGFRTNNYFGQQVLTDWDGFKVLGLKKPANVDTWNLDLDYLSYRGIAAGSEIGWFGKELIPDYASEYFGYFDVWGLKDYGKDVLGGGPAILTDTGIPPTKLGYQRTSVPPGERFRGRVLARHMQSLMTDESDPLDDFRLQLEGAYVSDRYFMEQYYKRLNETGMDQSTLAYLIRSRGNSAFTVLTEGNFQNFNTETQWLPRLDYYRLGDSLFGGRLNYYQHTGADYGNTHTASEVNNPNPFNVTPDSPILGTAFIPYDPTSNTTGVFKTGRLSTAHELDIPLNFDFLRLVPYGQVQAVGWNNQINGESVGRLWGAYGARADVMAHRAFPTVENELFNVHGLNHKANFVVDYRNAYSNVGLNRLGVQDDIDDNTYEFVRRYFALVSYGGGILPAQYDPRLLITRRGLSPITGTTDLQTSIDTVHMGIHQRLQTKRGPEGARRIIDWMTFDIDTTYFPQASRDNFGKPFGQNTYNYEWFVGDRTSIVSSGWFEFFDISGESLNKVNPKIKNDPFGLEMINIGVAVARPPSASFYVGYNILNSGVITTSALNAMYSYQMSPKWFSTMATSYDFGNAILLGAMFSVTRIGPDFLTTVGLSVDPQRRSYTFGFELVPRLSPGIRVGSVGGGMNRFDPRYAPTQ
jgi:hypothetical protein